MKAPDKLPILDRSRALWRAARPLAALGVLLGRGGQVLEAADVAAVHPEALLQPTPTGRRITALAAFGQQLYLGYGDYDANTGPIHIRALALADGGLSEPLLRFAGEAIYLYRSVNGRLYAPDIDPREGQRRGGYAEGVPGASGVAWRTRKPVDATHIYDVVSLDGRDLWLFGSREAQALAWRSRDGGHSWRVALVLAPRRPEKGDFARFYGAFVFDGRLYTQPWDYYGGNWATSKVFDGQGWSEGPPLLPSPQGHLWKPLMVGGVAVYLSAHAGLWATPLYAFDGRHVQRLWRGDVPARRRRFYDISAAGGRLYALNAAGEVWTTADLYRWDYVARLPDHHGQPVSLAVVGRRLFAGTTEARVLRLPLPRGLAPLGYRGKAVVRDPPLTTSAVAE